MLSYLGMKSRGSVIGYSSHYLILGVYKKKIGGIKHDF